MQSKLKELVAQHSQKNRKLNNRAIALKQLQDQVSNNDYFHHCFGSKKLFQQGQLIGTNEAVFATREDWRRELTRRKYHHLLWVGNSDSKYGFQDVKVDLENQKVAIRLLDRQAETRLAVEANGLGIVIDKVPHKLLFKRLILACEFNKKRAKLLTLALEQNLPITYQLTEQLTPKGERQRKRGSAPRGQEETAWYLHASFDLPPKAIQHSRHLGVLGVDLNAWGLAWSITKADGNLMKEPTTGRRLVGNIPIDTRRHLSSEQIRSQFLQAIVQLSNLAEQYKVAIAIEDLDFSKARNQAKEKGKNYARMIHKLKSTGFQEMITSRCCKQGIALHLVNPKFTSLGGFVKYGFLNGFSVDQAASFMIARRALRAKLWQPLQAHTNDKEGKPYKSHYIKQQQQKLDLKLENQVLNHQEPCIPAVPVPLADWVSFTKNKAYEMGKSQTRKITWYDWKHVLGKDRKIWYGRMLNLTLKQRSDLKATNSNLGNPQVSMTAKAIVG